MITTAMILLLLDLSLLYNATYSEGVRSGELIRSQ
jgi:hypothetical protein